MGVEGRRMGRPWGRCSTGCQRWEARGWQRKAGAGIHPSGRTRWAVVAVEEWEPQEDSHLPQSGRSTQKRQHGPRGTPSGGESEGEAGGRWSDDYGTAF